MRSTWSVFMLARLHGITQSAYQRSDKSLNTRACQVCVARWTKERHCTDRRAVTMQHARATDMSRAQCWWVRGWPGSVPGPPGMSATHLLSLSWVADTHFTVWALYVTVTKEEQQDHDRIPASMCVSDVNSRRPKRASSLQVSGLPHIAHVHWLSFVALSIPVAAERFGASGWYADCTGQRPCTTSSIRMISFVC